MAKVMLRGKKLVLRNVEDEDVEPLWRLRYSYKNPEWKKWDAPYWPLEMITLDEFKEQMKSRMNKDNDSPVHSQLIIEVKGKVIGSIIYYWEDERTRWLEIGIGIYESTNWKSGYGTEALVLFTDYLFKHLQIERVGLTTWSGNQGMMRASEKAGMKLEGRLRKCRYYNGQYYDSIRMGIIKEEWLNSKQIELQN